jgi:hypothetical protein
MNRIEDIEGTDCLDVAAARKEAVANARDLMATAIRQGRDISSRRIEITDVDGNLVLIVPFREAVSETE